MDRRSLLAGLGTAGLGVSLLPIAKLSAAEGQGGATIVYSYLAAWNFHSVERAARYFSDDVVYFDASVGEPVVGKEAATSDVVANFINAVPDLTWGIRGAPIVMGERVAFEWEFAGTNTGAWVDGTAASNKRFRFPGASVFEIRDGLIVHQADYYDALGFYKQLGWI
ncbi:ester cyclase [Devosia sp. CN2-171]|jgi:steroid delta-isomerase-like uncharacterized protein|uniref:ester cyclase n=1 Tax=Devosia sp. CN2-171 TaxID=3400909 RepID=UPI003BF7EBFB